MNVTRRNFLAGAGIAATAVLAGCGSSNGSSDGGSASGEKTYKIGVVQLTEHAALDASNEGFVEAVNASASPSPLTSRTPRTTSPPARPSPPSSWETAST